MEHLLVIIRSDDTDENVPTWRANNSLIRHQLMITLAKHSALPLLHG